MSIRLILDTSAVLAYSRGDVNVGEPIAEVADGDDEFGLPYACLVDAALRVTPAELAQIQVLTTHGHGIILTPDGEQWREAAGLARYLGRVDLAAALLAAGDHDASILTAEPDAYREPGTDVIIPI